VTDTPGQRVDIRHGDCLNVLRTLPDASVDAIVTDPPYELGFMGKRWDASGIAYSVELWAECLRVLKPGGHLASFGGTRTYHRMACAVEDAGFEIRDSIHWIMGSGFPKSLDVSKAIDRIRDWTLIERLAGEIKRARAEAGLSLRDIGQAVQDATEGQYGAWYHRGGHMFFETGRSLPSRPEWDRLRTVLPIQPEFITVYDEAEREITQEEKRPLAPGDVISFDQRSSTERERRDIPATDAARQWSGWGTALKPSVEPVVVAVKPLGTAGMLAEIGSHLDRLEFECSSLAKPAVQSSGPTHPPSGRGKAGSAPASAATQPVAEQAPLTGTGAVDASSAPTATSASASEAETCLNTVTSWRVCWAELCALTSTSTTATTSSTTTDLRTLSSCLSRLTPESITQGLNMTSGLSSTASAVDSLFAACVLYSRATLALSADEIATGGTPTSPPAGVAPECRPAVEPIVLARKPLAGMTVAACVLEHGTGALNIDGTRVNPGEPVGGGGNGTANVGGIMGPKTGTRPIVEPHTQGRWPANVLLSHGPDCADVCTPGCPVAELDTQSGTLKSGKLNRANITAANAIYGQAPATLSGEYEADSGGASRFFAQFRYQAKAPASQRPSYVTDDGRKIAHCTVKPLDLMRWLVRLITPPGGLVLDPFAGSGTTVEAALLEGFDVIAVEREADYLPLIQQRVDRVRGQFGGPDAAGSSEALGLFDLPGEGVA
jgi:DNA modification methylase